MGTLMPVIVFTAIASAMAVAIAAQVTGNAVEGHTLAIRVCGHCHVVASDQEWMPLLRIPTPSFREIANRKATTAVFLQKFVLTTHSRSGDLNIMPVPMRTEEQAADIASYILSLKNLSGKW
jgi:hypothetical protein